MESMERERALLRRELIEILEERGVEEIEGKPLEECYRYELTKAIANLDAEDEG